MTQANAQGERGEQSRETQTAEQIRKADMAFDRRRWEAAMAFKRTRPELRTESIDPGSQAVAAAAGHGPGCLFGEQAGDASVKRLKQPPDQSSFGFVGACVEVVTKAKALQAQLVLRFDRKQLGAVARESLRLFRWDKAARRYTLVGNSSVSHEGDYVHGQIARPGVYLLVGLTMDPAQHLAVRTFCANRRAIELLPAKAAGVLRDRICQVILCAPDLANFYEPGFMQAFEQGLGSDGWPPPGNWPPTGNGPTEPPGDICSRCTAVPVGVVPPECELLGPPGHGGTSACSDGPWVSAGPINLSGDIRQVLVDPSDSRRLYCAASNGGAWVLDNIDNYPSQAWRPLTDQLENLQMRALAVAAADPQVLYAANALNYLYRSTDRGANWARCSNTDLGDVRRIAVHPADANTVFVASSAGLRLSTDGGSSWSVQYSGDALDFVVDPLDTSILYLGVRSVGVLKSTTLGFGAWTAVLDWSRAADPTLREIRIAIGQHNRDGSLQTDANRFVAAKFGLELFVNQHGGRATAAGWVSRGSRGMTSQLWWDNVLAVDPFDPDVIFSGEQTLDRSGDGGGTWSTVASYYAPHEDQKCMAFDPDHNGVAYLANDGGVFRSSDGGRTWILPGTTTSGEIAARRNLTRDLATAEFYRVGVQGVRSVGNLYHSGIIAASNLPTGAWEGIEGHAWEFANVHADPRRSGRFYVFHAELARRRFPGTGSDDFTPYGRFQPYGGSAVGCIAVDLRPGSNTILVGAHPAAGGSAFRLMMTNEGDREPRTDSSGTVVDLPTWSEVVDSGTDPLVSVAFAPSAPGSAFAITRGGRVYTKADVNAAGAWSAPGQWATGDVRQLAIDATSPAQLSAITGNRVAHSADGGASWVEVGAATLPMSEFNSIVAHPRVPGQLYLGADIGVFMSPDQGQTWHAFDMNLPNAEVLQVFMDAGQLYAVTHGRGLWRRRIC